MRLFTFSIITLVALISTIKVNSQTIVSDGFETWTDASHPSLWFGSKSSITAANVAQYTTNVHGGTYAVKLTNNTATHVRFTTQPVSVTAGTVYTISFWVRGHGDIRTNIWDGAYGTYNAYISVNSSTWAQQTQTVTAASTLTSAEIIFSIRNTVADIDNIQIDDVTINGPAGASAVINITAPAYNTVVYSPDVNVSFVVSNFVIANGTGDGHVNCKVDAGTATPYYDANPIAITGLSAGLHTIVLELVNNANASLTPIAIDTVKITTNLTPPVAKTIYEIQYTISVPAVSPYLNVLVTTTGVVTGKCGSGFFMQDGAGGWNGIFVLTSAYPALAVGDNVTVTGLVYEYYDLTEIKSLASLTINSSGNAEPAPSTVNSTTLKQEQFESVLVTITNAKCISLPSALPPSYNMWTVKDGLNAGDTCKIHNLLFAASPSLNSIYTVTGPVYYDFSEYKIEPRSAADVTVGIEDIYTLEASIYPNPASNFVTISAKEAISNVSIYDFQGRIVLVYNFNNSSEVTLNISELSKGIYNIVATSNEGNSFTTKFIK